MGIHHDREAHPAPASETVDAGQIALRESPRLGDARPLDGTRDRHRIVADVADQPEALQPLRRRTYGTEQSSADAGAPERLIEQQAAHPSLDRLQKSQEG